MATPVQKPTGREIKGDYGTAKEVTDESGNVYWTIAMVNGGEFWTMFSGPAERMVTIAHFDEHAWKVAHVHKGSGI